MSNIVQSVPRCCADCDHTGVFAVVDWPTSRVLICGNWPVDADEPPAYWEAQQWLHPAPPPRPELLAAVEDAVREQPPTRGGNCIASLAWASMVTLAVLALVWRWLA